MKTLAPTVLFSLVAGYVLAHFLVAFYNHWYFANFFWLKVCVAAVVIGVLFFILLHTSWCKVWRGLGIYWIVTHVLAMVPAGGPDLREMEFVAVLDFEAAVVWLPLAVLLGFGAWRMYQAERAARLQRNRYARELALRRKLRKAKMDIKYADHQQAPASQEEPAQPVNPVLLLAILALVALLMPLTAIAQEEPPRPYPDRHAELTDAAARLGLQMPGLPGTYPEPLQLREHETFWIVIENWADGRIFIAQHDGVSFAEEGAEVLQEWRIAADVGQVLSPVSQVNRRGFTASGWAGPGTVCATAVNAIHIKTDHDYDSGRGVIFSLLPMEQAEVDPAQYQSYLSHPTSLQTNITAGEGIFGGQWAPLTGSRLMSTAAGAGADWESAANVEAGWEPVGGEVLVLEVARRKYNPEYIEFENRFGGLIWVKELDLKPYPIGQVLKPVVGIGRFLGTQFADVGRIRAAHPGVICVSTSPAGEVGGFQIIPRDHAMSPELTYVRVKTQWMVVGPLWALDPSWEGLPPLFSDYLYPAFIPALNPDGSVNEDAQGADVFLDRFTVRGRYADAEDPEQYELLREYVYLHHTALEKLTHLRIYFPRG